MNQDRKEAFAARFVERPLLLMLVRALLFSVWFRFFFVACLFVPLVGVGMLVKMWHTTPPDFRPEVRVSGLDYLQAWALRRSGDRFFREGKLDEAVQAWRSALANTPADVSGMRVFLQRVNALVEPPKFQTEVLPLAAWFIRLSGTNVADLALSAETFVNYGLSSYALSLLAPYVKGAGATVTQAYLQALFNEDRVPEFESVWRAYPQRDELMKVPVLELYWAAFEAGWGGAAEDTRALGRLEAVLEDARWRVVASRLYLKVCVQRLRVERYFEVLDRLQTLQRDTVREHVQGWRLLAANNRQAEAVKLAQGFPSRPMSAQETLLLAQTFYDLGLGDLALQTLDRFSLQFGAFDELWVSYGNLLAQAQRWEKLQEIATSIRGNDAVRLRLRALSYYFEGRAELARNHRAAADEAFARISGLAIENLGIAFGVARNLHSLGYARLSREILLAKEKEGDSQFPYWRLVGQVAYDLRDTELLVKAARRAFELTPLNPESMHNYAATLLTTRQRPEEAMKWTFELLQKSPGNVGVRLNYTLALLQNARLDEAAVELNRLAQSNLKPAEKATFDYARCELLARRGRKEEARAIHRGLKAESFFVTEWDYLGRLVEVDSPAAGR